MNTAQRIHLLAIAAAAGLAVAAHGQSPVQSAELQRLAREHAVRQGREQSQARAWAQRLGLRTRQVNGSGPDWELAGLRNGRPFYRGTHNLTALETVSAHKTRQGAGLGFSLTGAGVALGVWDSGSVRTSHVEFGSRAVSLDGAGLSGHGTHVGGTMAAAGIDPKAVGMSLEAMLRSYDWNSDLAEMAAEAASGLRVSNHSYGQITGWAFGGFSGAVDWHWFGDVSLSETEDASFGYYSGESAAWDEVAFNAPYYLPVKSAGNDRGEGPSGIAGFFWNGSAWAANTVARDKDGGASGYDTIAEAGVSKNVLTVGAISGIPGGYTKPSDAEMSFFSCWGPTDDGRIKPDIVGNGVGLFSTTANSDTSYGVSSGTSMSSPNVSGSLGLLIDHYRATHAGQDMRSASLKGLIIHTADEAGSGPGPDYSFGWGVLNVFKAAKVISDDATFNTIQEGVLDNGKTIEIPVYHNGQGAFKATLSWTDPKGVPAPPALDPAKRMLVNDLDLRVIGNGLTFRPWILDPANPSNIATTGDNNRDNVEQVMAPSAPQGWYTLRISHKQQLAGGMQAFSIITDSDQPVVQPAPPIPSVFLGALFRGNASSVAASDRNYYEVASELIPNAGMYAGAVLDFQLPMPKASVSSYSVSLEALRSGGRRVTGMIFMYNFKGAKWELVRSLPLEARSAASVEIAVPPAKYDEFTADDGRIRVLVRSHEALDRFFGVSRPHYLRVDFGRLNLN
jgi:hypothetical protein